MSIVAGATVCLSSAISIVGPSPAAPGRDGPIPDPITKTTSYRQIRGLNRMFEWLEPQLEWNLAKLTSDLPLCWLLCRATHCKGPALPGARCLLLPAEPLVCSSTTPSTKHPNSPISVGSRLLCFFF